MGVDNDHAVPVALGDVERLALQEPGQRTRRDEVARGDIRFEVVRQRRERGRACGKDEGHVEVAAQRDDEYAAPLLRQTEGAGVEDFVGHHVAERFQFAHDGRERPPAVMGQQTDDVLEQDGARQMRRDDGQNPEEERPAGVSEARPLARHRKRLAREARDEHVVRGEVRGRDGREVAPRFMPVVRLVDLPRLGVDVPGAHAPVASGSQEGVVEDAAAAAKADEAKGSPAEAG